MNLNIQDRQATLLSATESLNFIAGRIFGVEEQGRDVEDLDTPEKMAAWANSLFG